MPLSEPADPFQSEALEPMLDMIRRTNESVYQRMKHDHYEKQRMQLKEAEDRRGQKCLWHYTENDLTGKYLWIFSSCTEEFYTNREQAKFATGATTACFFRCIACGPQYAWLFNGVTPGGATEWRVMEASRVQVVSCTYLSSSNKNK
jgi:hypothetical protein